MKQFWGFNSFRPLQEDIVDSVIYGHDTLAILPTGGGKSICFQVPGTALEGVTIVISPLIALMQDQVNNLEKRGIRASLITSSMSYREIDIALDNARFGNTKFLYTSPERLKSELFKERFKRMNVGLIAIDEAHCISEWGHDFRPAYREISAIRQYHPETPIIALTASATSKVQADIVEQLKLKHPKKYIGTLKRENLHYAVRESKNKISAITEYCSLHKLQSGIVYCQTRRSVKQLAAHLRANGVSAGVYHGGLSSDDRKFMLESWMSETIKVMVATNAFGMGIDKPNVRFVLHFEVPSNIEAYYQESGRAGRDEKEANAIVYWEKDDLNKLNEQLEKRYPEKERIKSIYNSISNFLSVALGSGKDETYPFDIQNFSNSFGIGIQETFYALKILHLNGSLYFSESNFHPTRLKIVIGNEALYKFQVSHTTMAPLITLISRSYPGIFDRFIPIDEEELRKRLKITKIQLREKLEFLEQYGAIDISYQSHLPLITYLHERLADSHLRINSTIHSNREKVEKEKLRAMTNFITSTDCRNVLISNYFNSKIEPCGHCDNCNQKKGVEKGIVEAILNNLPSSINELELKLPYPQTEIEKIIREMMHEGVITYHDSRYFIA